MSSAKRRRALALLVACALGLGGCEWLSAPVAPAPDPPPAPVTYPVAIAFDDNADENHFFHPHASIVGAAWAEPPACGSEAIPAFCHPDRSLPRVALALFNDGNVALTRAFGEVEVWNRAGAQVVVLPWLEETFKTKGNEVNAWEPRETVQVELDLRGLCRDRSVPVCAPSTFTAGAVSRLVVRLEAVEVLPGGLR